jgi:hypothetical protein
MKQTFNYSASGWVADSFTTETEPTLTAIWNHETTSYSAKITVKLNNRSI